MGHIRRVFVMNLHYLLRIETITMSRDLNDGERIRSRFQGGLVRLFFLCLAILHSQQGLTRWFATKWPTVLVHYIVIKLFKGEEYHPGHRKVIRQKSTQFLG